MATIKTATLYFTPHCTTSKHDSTSQLPPLTDTHTLNLQTKPRQLSHTAGLVRRRGVLVDPAFDEE